MNNKADKALTYVMGTIMFVMVLGALWQVFSRYVLSKPSTVTEELLRYMLIWSTMIGSIVGFMYGEHMALTLLSSRLKGQTKALLLLVIDVIILAVFVFFILPGGIRLVNGAMRQLSPILQIPVGYVYVIIPLMALCVSVIKVVHIIRAVKLIKEVR